MTLRILMASLLLSLGLTAAHNAQAELITVEESYELGAEQVILPSTTRGSLLLRTCPHCQVISIQVDSETQFFLGREAVTLQRFRRDGVMQGIIYVYYKPDTQRVTRVRLPQEAVRAVQDLDVDDDSDD